MTVEDINPEVVRLYEVKRHLCALLLFLQSHYFAVMWK